MKSQTGPTQAIQAYVTGVCVLAVVLGSTQDWAELAALTTRDYWGLATLVLLGLVSETQALQIKVGRVAGRSSIAFLPLVTIGLLFGPVAAFLCMAINGPVTEYLIRKKEPLRANFNVAQLLVATAVAGMAFRASGGVPLVGAESPPMVEQFGPFVLFGVVLLVLNNASVAGAISISQGIPFAEAWSGLVGRSGTNIFYDLLIGPIAIAVAALYIQVGTTGILLAILPLFFIRHSYLTTHQLQQANADLLKALVKAIETRDPYTSGHSLRVSSLARKIAEALGLSAKTVEHVETAALLHDIGKIEAVYTEILRKPDALTPQEREIIESHVGKGVELLRNLSSVPEEVIRSVRHHHEREDGTGYPDGLSGDEIPIGAKIIVVCDAVDAMLSDRPYRKALSITDVMQQLSHHSAAQFDPLLVATLVHSGLLSEYVDMMRGPRDDFRLRDMPGAARTLPTLIRRARGRTFPAVPH